MFHIGTSLLLIVLCSTFQNAIQYSLHDDFQQFGGLGGKKKIFDLKSVSQQDTENNENEIDESHCRFRPTCPEFFQQMFRTADGTCNNRVQPNFGSRERSFKRLIPADYEDRNGSLRLSVTGRPLPSARVVSNTLQGRVSTSTPSSHMLPFWGQFLAHDMTLTSEFSEGTGLCNCNEITTEKCVNIVIPSNDIQQSGSTSKPCFLFVRSPGVANSYDCSTEVRQQLNEITSFLDMNLIYGNSETQLNNLRSLLKPGELVYVMESDHHSAGFLLPQTNFSARILNASQEEPHLQCPGDVVKPNGALCRVSGEPRANENSVLLSHHTIWVRLHNKIARELRMVNPQLNSDTTLKYTKLIVTSLSQKVTFEHFLPIIIGENLMKQFGLTLLNKGFWYGYDSSYDATTSNSFATAAFRMGHPLINEFFSRPNATFNGNQSPNLRLNVSLFNVGEIEEGEGPNSFIRGLTTDSALTFDPTFTNSLRNFLFTPNQNGTELIFGDDLLSRNIQRGRDHGLAPYLKYREFCGLSIPRTFIDLIDTMDIVRIFKLKRVYSNLMDIDLYAGGVSERSVEGGTVGPTFACIIGYQFRDLKRGDRFWHENAPPIGPFSKAQLDSLRTISLPRILCDTVDGMISIQPWPLRKENSITNQRKNCNTYPVLDLSAWSVNNPKKATRDQDIEKTAWFPARVGPIFETYSVTELYAWLLKQRPNEICRQVIRTEERSVHGNKQYRFSCLPGTISYSSYPPIPSEKYAWSSWQFSNRTKNIVKALIPNNTLQRPYAIQVQTTNGVLANKTGDVFTYFSPNYGLLCRDSEQLNGRCNEYKVRYLYRRNPRIFG